MKINTQQMRLEEQEIGSEDQGQKPKEREELMRNRFNYIVLGVLG